MENRVVFLDMPKTRVYLRPIEKGDVPFLTKARNNEYLCKFMTEHTPTTIEEEENWHSEISKKKKDSQLCSIVLKDTQEIIGIIGLHNINWIDRTATTGTFIGREDVLGKGLGTEAKMLWLKHAFLTLNLRMIISRAYAFNGRSIRYSEKCGYRQIAVYPDFVFREGKYHDMIHLMVTREMWEPLWQQFEQKMKGEKSE